MKLVCLAVSLMAAGCGGRAVLSQQIDARSLASELRVAFTKASEAADLAVMADTDQASAAAARESTAAADKATGASRRLRAVLTSLGYSGELHTLDQFDERFAQYRKLDSEILTLAVENTNLKAQRLSFGQSADAQSAFRAAVSRMAAAAPPASTSTARLAADDATIALLEIQVLQAPHIAETEESGMTQLEARMRDSETRTRAALQQLERADGPAAAAQAHDADAALARFLDVNREIVRLSRRNSNVRSLALSLGRKRTIVAECDDLLRSLEESLSQRGLAATR